MPAFGAGGIYLWTVLYRIYMAIQHIYSKLQIFSGTFGKLLKCLCFSGILVKCLCHGVILVWHIFSCHALVRCFVLVP